MINHDKFQHSDNQLVGNRVTIDECGGTIPTLPLSIDQRGALIIPTSHILLDVYHSLP